MPELDWRSRIDELTNVQRLVHLALRMDAVDESNTSSQIFSQKRKAYEDELTRLIKQVGGNQPGRTSSATLSDMKAQSDEEAAGIINTYNYNLIGAIKSVTAEAPKANRHVFASKLKAWHNEHMKFKSAQIALHNLTEWRTKAQHDFQTYNDVTGYAELVPHNEAVCETCKDWVARGKVKLAEAKAIMDTWPPHVNCCHTWNVSLGKVSNPSELWTGVEPGDFKEFNYAISQSPQVVVAINGEVRS